MYRTQITITIQVALPTKVTKMAESHLAKLCDRNVVHFRPKLFEFLALTVAFLPAAKTASHGSH
jgi:hypothetical protein